MGRRRSWEAAGEGEANKRVSRTKRRAQHGQMLLHCCSQARRKDRQQQRQSLPLPISRNAISDRSRIEQAEAQLKLRWSRQWRQRDLDSDWTWLGAFLGSALTKQVQQVRSGKDRSASLEQVQVACRRRLMICKFSNMHLLLLLAGAAAACVRCAMINCRRCTQSSSFPLSQWGSVACHSWSIACCGDRCSCRWIMISRMSCFKKANKIIYNTVSWSSSGDFLREQAERERGTVAPTKCEGLSKRTCAGLIKMPQRN